uniref:Hemiferrin n=1 Tax=Rattus norvegicus TaxID=10116 RepID=Q64599_RAT|nr:hemiferrin, transferrin-like protein [Rattus norvegicus]AAA41316.1 hemiferrin [Rattus norvegicus]
MLYSKINNCKFDEFFSAGCAPGSPRNSSSLCALCIGSEKGTGKECVPNSNERYYGYTGAFRCLVEKGDVAFVKDQTVIQNTDGNNNEAWAKNMKKENFEVLCKDGTRKPVTDAENCHLPEPNHAVVSRKDKATCVEKILNKQQDDFGKSVTDCTSNFCLFQSNSKDLLFRDDTKCLASIAKKTYDSYLGDDYVRAMTNLRQCSTSKLLEACTFHKP